MCVAKRPLPHADLPFAELTREFLNILSKTPLRLKKRLMSFRVS